jgi:hypothetical protein
LDGEPGASGAVALRAKLYHDAPRELSVLRPYTDASGRPFGIRLRRLQAVNRGFDLILTILVTTLLNGRSLSAPAHERVVDRKL